MHFPSPDRTIWHITFGTYGTRLHGGVRPTVDRRHNEVGDPFLDLLARYEQVEKGHMPHPPRLLSADQCHAMDAEITSICQRGGWTSHAWVVQSDHVHLLIEADRGSDGKTIRTLIKRWTTQLLSDRFPMDADYAWWAEGGSNKAVESGDYFVHAKDYISRHHGGMSLS